MPRSRMRREKVVQSDKALVLSCGKWAEKEWVEA